MNDAFGLRATVSQDFVYRPAATRISLGCPLHLLWAVVTALAANLASSALDQMAGDEAVVIAEKTDLKHNTTVVETTYRGNYLKVRDVNGNWLWVDSDGRCQTSEECFEAAFQVTSDADLIEDDGMLYIHTDEAPALVVKNP